MFDIMDLVLLGCAAWFLWNGYTYLFDKDRAWQKYEARQRKLRQDDNPEIERTDEWSTVATMQGVVYTALAALGVFLALSA